MKGKNDDLPEDHEKQGRPDKKQPSLTLEQVKKAVETAVSPLVKQIKALADDQVQQARGFVQERESLRTDVQQLISELKDAGVIEIPKILVDLNSKLELVQQSTGQTSGEIRSIKTAAETTHSLVESVSGAVSTGFETQAALLSSAGEVANDRHAEVLGRLDHVDTEIKNTRSDIANLDTKIGELLLRAERLEGGLSDLLKQAGDLKALSIDIKTEIGTDGSATREATATALGQMADHLDAISTYIVDETGRLIKVSEQESTGSLKASLAEIIQAVNNVPGMLGKEFMGKFAQIVSLADKIARGGEMVAEHLMTLSESTTQAFSTHQMLVRSMKAEFNNQIVGLGTLIHDKTIETFDRLETKIDKSFEAFANSDISENVNSTLDMIITLRQAYGQFEQLVEGIDDFRTTLAKENTNLRQTVDGKTRDLVEAIGAVSPSLEKTKQHIDAVMAGVANAEGAAVALVNRISAASLEAYKRDLEAMGALHVEEQQDAQAIRRKERDEDLSYLKDFMRDLLMDQAAAFAKAVLDTQDAEILADDAPQGK
jgi:hypothetical protein